MCIAGKPNETIRKELGISERTLVVWMSDDLVKEYLQTLAENVEREFAQEIARASFIAMGEVTDMVQMPVDVSALSPRQKLDAASQILDRNPALAKLTDKAQMAAALNGGGGAGGAQGNVTNYLAVFQNMPDDALADFLRQWRDGGGHDNGGPPVIEGSSSGD